MHYLWITICITTFQCTHFTLLKLKFDVHLSCHQSQNFIHKLWSQFEGGSSGMLWTQDGAKWRIGWAQWRFGRGNCRQKSMTVQRSLIDLGPKVLAPIVTLRDEQHARFFFWEVLTQSGPWLGWRERGRGFITSSVCIWTYDTHQIGRSLARVKYWLIWNLAELWWNDFPELLSEFRFLPSYLL